MRSATARGPAVRRPPGAVDRAGDASAGENRFWRLVLALRVQVSERMLAASAGVEAAPPRVREEKGREHILRVIQDADELLRRKGQPGWSDMARARLAKALFDVTFRLGRIQELVDIPTVETIEIYGYDRVVLLHTDGRRTQGPPVAESDRDLVGFLRFLAARDPDPNTEFSPGAWELNMTLPGRARLAATYWTTPRPRVTIRLQRLRQVDLAMLEGMGELDRVLGAFLAAAVRAGKSIVVSGRGRGSGRTTVLRALCAALDPWESIATVESDMELYLHEDADRHPRVLPLQSRVATPTAAGGSGGASTSDLIRASARHHVERIVVGDIRDGDAMALCEAEQAGNGSLSTMHANSAEDVVERLVGLAMRDSTVSEAFAYRTIAQSIDLIVHIARDQSPDGRSFRYITEVAEVTRGSNGAPITVTQLFGPDAHGRAVPRAAPTFLAELERAGFPRELLNHSAGLWGHR